MRLFTAIVLSLLAGIVLFAYGVYRWIWHQFGDCTIDQIFMHIRMPILSVPPAMVYSAISHIVIIVIFMIVVFLFFWKGVDLIQNRQFWNSVWNIVRTAITVVYRFCSRHFRPLCTIVALALVLLSSWGIYREMDQHFNLGAFLRNYGEKTTWFEDNYIFVKPEDVHFSQKKNVILILAESLENTYTDPKIFGENLLPRLSALNRENMSFSRHFQVNGTGWTIAALTSYFYGVPRLAVYGIVNNNSGEYPVFYTPSVWDIFLQNGYACKYVQGGTMEFASKRRLFSLLPEVTVRCFNDYCRDPEYVSLPEKPEFGVNDQVLFRHLSEETAGLAKEGKPFFLAVLTMDTHAPGFLSPRQKLNAGHEKHMMDVILEQDRMIAEYIQWIKHQPFAKDTVIIVGGDHLAMDNELFQTYLDPMTIHFNDYAKRDSFSFTRSNKRTVFNCIMFPDGRTAENDRIHASFDWAPTLLEAAGATLPDGRFGVGVSLFSKKKNLLERNGIEWYEDEVLKRQSGYDRLFEEKKIRNVK